MVHPVRGCAPQKFRAGQNADEHSVNNFLSNTRKHPVVVRAKPAKNQQDRQPALASPGSSKEVKQRRVLGRDGSSTRGWCRKREHFQLQRRARGGRRTNRHEHRDEDAQHRRERIRQWGTTSPPATGTKFSESIGRDRESEHEPGSVRGPHFDARVRRCFFVQHRTSQRRREWATCTPVKNSSE
jgi:hypothetical protein